MADWTSWTIPIIVPFVTIVASLLIPTIFVQGPTVDLLIEPNENTNEVLLKINNSGSKSANNLSILLDAGGKNISSVTNDFSSVPIGLPAFNSTLEIGQTQLAVNSPFLDINIDRFPQGQGTFTQLKISNYDNKSTIEEYSAFAVFDEGSSRFPTIQSAWSVYSVQVILLTSVTALVVELPTLYILRRLRIRRVAVSIIDNLFKIRRILNENENSEDVLEGKWRVRKWDVRPKSFFEDKDEKVKLDPIEKSLFRYPNDYAMLDDVYNALAKRNQAIEKKDLSGLRNHNKEILKLVDEAITKIDWSKYKWH